MKYIIHTDGGARGNPGPAAIGVVIQTADEKIISELGKRIGETTNNVAEYSAVLEALREVKSPRPDRRGGQKSKVKSIDFYLDSTLVVNQLNGLYKVKDAKLRELLARVKILEQEVGGVVTYTAVPREQNQRADWLVNRALDEG